MRNLSNFSKKIFTDMLILNISEVFSDHFFAYFYSST